MIDVSCYLASDQIAKIRGVGALAPGRLRLILRIDYLLGVNAPAAFGRRCPSSRWR